MALFHRSFSLNGREFSEPETLIHYSKTAVPSIHHFLENWFDTSDMVSVQTSGSTGSPKTIRLKKVHMINSARATAAHFKLSEGSTALLCLSTDFIAGKMMLVRALVLGWRLDVVDPIKNPLAQLEKDYDFSAMVPMQVYHSLDQLPKLKKLIVGGGVISKDLERVLKSSPTEVFATFGMTETITHIAARQLATKANSYENQNYQVLPGVKISKDHRGCMIIDAPDISDTRVYTNDLIDLISDQEFRWLGRYDSIINSGGIKVIPEVIEEKIDHLLEKRFFVTGISDPILGQRVVLIVEAANTDNTLLDRLRNQTALTAYELPKDVYFTANFVETETKKIQRRKTLDLIFNQ